MDLDNHNRRYDNENEHEHEHEHEQENTNSSADRFPLPTLSTLSSLSSSPGSRRASQDSAGIASYVHPPPPNMDGSADGHRRRRGLLAGKDENDGVDGKARGKHRSRRVRIGNAGAESEQESYPSDEDNVSDFSSRSISDDVELHHIASEDGLTDDEETGLTREDKRNRKRRKKKNTLLDQRIIGTGKISKQDGNSADKNVLRASLINALLIASWYLFSLSISIVSMKQQLRVLFNH